MRPEFRCGVAAAGLRAGDDRPKLGKRERLEMREDGSGIIFAFTRHERKIAASLTYSIVRRPITASRKRRSGPVVSFPLISHTIHLRPTGGIYNAKTFDNQGSKRPPGDIHKELL